jgi:hypothetical protein
LSGGSAGRVAEPVSDGARREAESELTEQLAATVGSEWSLGHDDWELDEQLRHIGRVLAEARHEGPPSHEGPPGQTSDRGNTVVRVDSAHAEPAGRHLPLPGRQSAEPTRQAPGSLPIWTWATMLLGLTAFVCGGVLLGWSIVSGREDLWSIGLPIALGGQIGLLVALVLQLDRLWHNNRSTEAKLDRVDDRLHDLLTRIDEPQGATGCLSASAGQTPNVTKSTG